MNFEANNCPQKAVSVGAAAPGKKTLKSYGAASATTLGDAAISEALSIGTTCESKAPKQAASNAVAQIRNVFPLTDATVTNNKVTCSATNWKNLGS